MAPGPTNLDYRVYRAMTTPVLGHMDPEFLRVMDSVGQKLRRVFRTENQITIPVSGTGSAGMEAAMFNFLEPGDEVVVLVGGFFAQRMAEIADRTGAKVTVIETEWGKATDLNRVAEALRGRHCKAVGAVHGETSTGVLQQLEPLARLAHEHDAIFIADSVATLGGVPIEVDRMGVDVCYSGSQKCLSAPPGLAPITVSDRACALLKARKSKVQSWYLDLTGVEKYWGKERTYHHTAPISMVYALHEALSIVEEEGLENRWARHARNMGALQAGAAALGLKPLPSPQAQLSTVAALLTPAGIDEARVRSHLLTRFNIEIAGGLGPYKGKLWRVGVMGSSGTESNILLLLAALEILLEEEGALKASGRGVSAAQACLAQVPA